MSGPTSTPLCVPSPDGQCAHPFGQPGRELVGHVGVHEEAVGGGAGLAHVAHLRVEGRIDGDGRGRRPRAPGTARCHRAPSTCAGRARAACASRSLPTAVEPVKDSLRITPLSSISGTICGRPAGGQDAEHPVRQAGFAEQLCERQGGERGLRGGLEDADAPGGDRGRELAGAHGQREVPRDDQQAGTDRLLDQQVAGGAVGPVRVAAVDADGLLGEPAEEVRGVRDLAAGLGQGLAHLERHQHGQLLGAFDHELVVAVQDLRADAGRRGRPVRLDVGSGAQGTSSVGLGGVGDLGDDTLGRRIDHSYRGTGPGLPLAGDEQVMRDAVRSAGQIVQRRARGCSVRGGVDGHGCAAFRISRSWNVRAEACRRRRRSRSRSSVVSHAGVGDRSSEVSQAG